MQRSRYFIRCFTGYRVAQQSETHVKALAAWQASGWLRPHLAPSDTIMALPDQHKTARCAVTLLAAQA
jgi:hypothetical protein